MRASRWKIVAVIAVGAVGMLGCGRAKDAVGTEGQAGENGGGGDTAPEADGGGTRAPTAGTGPGGDMAATGSAGNSAGAAGTSATAGTGMAAVAPAVAPTIDGQLTINEFMAKNILSAHDEHGDASGWIELYNPTTQSIPLGGYGLSDAVTGSAKAVLPTGTIIPAGGHLVLWCDGTPAAGPTHLAIVMAPTGGVLTLSRPDGSYIDRLAYGAQEVDFSAAREPDGSDKWVVEWHVSMGAANPAGAGKPKAARAASDPPEVVPAAGDLTDQVLGYDVIPKLELQISPQGVSGLRAAPAEWVQATLVYQGRSYGPVGVNLKGTSSFQPIDQKPGFRVNINKFAKGARFFGLKEFYLNNMTTDPSMMHERLAYWIGRQVGGIPAARSNHSFVTLNGAPLGLYATVEEPKEQMLARYFTDATGPIYTIGYADFSSAYLPNFVLQDGTDDRSLIVGLTNALTMQPASVAMTEAGRYADLHQFTRYWAFSVLTGHWGGWPYAPDPQPEGANAGTYADPTTKLLNFIPEGINDDFTTADFDFMAGAKSVLAKTCAAVGSCYQDFAAQLMELLGKAETLHWAAEHDRVAAQIAPLTVMDTKKPYSNADVTMYQQQMGYFITGRPTFIMKYLVQPGSP